MAFPTRPARPLAGAVPRPVVRSQAIATGLEALVGLLSLLHGHRLQVRTLEQDMRRVTAQLAAGGLPDMEAWTPVGLLLKVGRLRTERVVMGQLDSWRALWKRYGEPLAMSLHEVDDLVC